MCTRKNCQEYTFLTERVVDYYARLVNNPTESAPEYLSTIFDLGRYPLEDIKPGYVSTRSDSNVLMSIFRLSYLQALTLPAPRAIIVLLLSIKRFNALYNHRINSFSHLPVPININVKFPRLVIQFPSSLKEKLGMLQNRRTT